MDNLTPITREEMLMNDEPLTPITREEKILAGEDLNPVTRREYFLKKYRHADGDVMVEGLEVTANGTYTAPEGKAYSPVEVAVPLPENAYLLKVASGSLVSFSDGADLPIPSFICNITANQDLHGYDAPWVGGAGKNKINLADITTPSAGFVYNRKPINVVVNTYTLSFNFTGSSGSISISLRNGETVVSTIQDMPLVNGLNTYTMPTLSDNADSISLYASIGGTYENFMLEIGSQATTYEPYSNICPISGWDEVNVTRTGKNLWSLGNISGIKQVDVDVNIPIGSWTFSCEITSADVDRTTSLLIFYYDDDTSFLTRLNRNTRVSYTFTATKHIKKISFYAGYNSSQSAGDTFAFANIQLEVGNQATAYEPYAGTTYTIDLDGTRYGGELDVVSGVLTVDRAYFKYINVSTTSGTAVTDGWRCSFTCPIDDINRGKWSIQTGAIPIFNKISSVAKGYGANEYTVTLPNVTSKQEADAMLEGLEICYKLATPQTYQLTPTQIKSLLGNNNAWCDTGDVDIDYFAKEVTG